MFKTKKLNSLKTALAFGALLLAILSCTISRVEPLTTPTAPSANFTPDYTGLGTPVRNSNLIGIPMQVGYGYRSAFFDVYFTDPLNTNASKHEGGLDMPLDKSIDEARISIDLAIYSINSYPIRDALIRAKKRGVEVRMVMESDNMKDPVPLELKKAGIPIVGDRRQGLMHNKFMVVDRAEVWTGSMNFTVSGIYEDNNNLIRIHSNKVAKDYLVEFDEMFKHDYFGPDTVAETPYPYVVIDGMPMEIYFSPDDHVANRIAQLLRGAKQSIYFMSYALTANDFGEILKDKSQEGMPIAGILEDSQIKSGLGSEYNFLKQAGMSIYKDGNPGLMHHKVFIIDQQIVITGSYNFTSSAETTNDENVTIIFDKQVAARYMEEYQRVYTQAIKAQNN